VISILAAITIASTPVVVDRVVAVVDGRPILLSELGPGAPKEAVEALIEKRLLQAEGRSRGLNVGDAEIDTAIEQVRSRNNIPDLATFKQAVEASGRTWTQYRTELGEQLLERQIMGQIMSQGTQVTDRELNEVIKREPELIESRHLRHLLLRLTPQAQDWEVQDAAARAKSLLAQLDSGTSFEELAIANSEDPSAGNGGDLGWIGRGITDPAFEKAAFQAAVGSVVGPVRSAFGVHLIQVVAQRRKADGKEQREMLRNMLRRRNAEAALKRTIERARRQALVKLIDE